jgi:hypothetical protein
MFCVSFGRRYTVGCLTAVLLLFGCGSDPDDGGPPICDIRSSECQSRVYEATAQLRGHGVPGRPEVRIATLDGLSEELRSETQANDTPEALQWWRAYELLGLVKPAQSPGDVMIDEWLRNVVAFYSDETKRVTIVDRGESVNPRQASYILAHEFVHALQDQQLDLKAFTKRWSKSTDSSLGIRSLVEGEATILSTMLLAQA